MSKIRQVPAAVGETEPFDLLTLFDYAKVEARAFEELVAAVRATEESKFVATPDDRRHAGEAGRGEG